MQVDILNDVGYDEALRGMSYSFKDRAEPVSAWWSSQRPKAMKRAEKLSKLDGGHNKFLEGIVLWIDIEAPRYWWSEFDTYRVGTSKLSESTMHVLSKREVTPSDFEAGDTLDPRILDVLNNAIRNKADIQTLKGVLPESYLQRRVVITNYKVIRNIILQRHDHRLELWEQFCKEMLKQVNHPELLPNPYETK